MCRTIGSFTFETLSEALVAWRIHQPIYLVMVIPSHFFSQSSSALADDAEGAPLL